MDTTLPGAASAPSNTQASVEASIVVDVPIEQAFAIFTADFGAWWPPSHHIGDAPLLTAIIEPRVGGRWYELCEDGSTCDWGVVLAWEPPRRVGMSWNLSPDFRVQETPGRTSRVDVFFSERPGGSTLVELVHSQLDNHGDGWQRLRNNVGSPNGWNGILRQFGQSLSDPPSPGTGSAVPTQSRPRDPRG
jgi:uncharacterized protein YndB with AHSA1/START domain